MFFLKKCAGIVIHVSSVFEKKTFKARRKMGCLKPQIVTARSINARELDRVIEALNEIVG